MVSVVGLVLYITLALLRPEFLLPLELSSFAMLAVILLTSVFAMFGALGNPWQPAQSTRFLCGLMAITTLSSLAIIGVSKDTWRGLLMLGEIALLYILLIQVVRTRARLRVVQWAFILLVVSLAVRGVLFSLGYETAGFSWDRAFRLQFADIFADSNDLAQIFVIVWSMLLYDLLNGKNIPIRLLELPALGFLGWALYLCSSRGATLGVLLSIVLALRRRVGLVLPSVLALVALVVMYSAGVARMDQLSTSENSAETRIKSWTQGWYMLRAHPLSGVGPQKFTDHHPFAAHSSVVQVAAETGLFGLFCWLGFFYFALQDSIDTLMPSLLRRFIRGPDNPPELTCQTWQLQSALIVCFEAGLFLSRAYVFVPYFTAGLAIAARNIDASEGLLPVRDRVTAKDLRRLAAVFFLVMLAWRFMIRHYVQGP